MFEKVEDFFLLYRVLPLCSPVVLRHSNLFTEFHLNNMAHKNTTPLRYSKFFSRFEHGRTERTFFVVIQRNVQFAFVRVRRECVCMCACAGIWSISKS